MIEENAVVIPATDLAEVETTLQKAAKGAISKAESYQEQLSAHLVDAKATQITDSASYLYVGAILTDVRGIMKQIKAEFSPFQVVIERMKGFFSMEVRRHTAVADLIEVECITKMKAHERAEREAAEAEQAKLNKRKDAAPVTVKPELPAVAGYRKSTTFPVEVTDFNTFMRSYATAVSKGDSARTKFLRGFLCLNESELAKYARTLKDPEEFMKRIPGVRNWRE